MKIEDGKGNSGDASVSSSQRLNVSAKTRDRTFYASRDQGLAFTAIYEDITADAGNIVAYLKSTSSTRNLFIKDIKAGGVEAIKWKVFSVSGTAASGESVIPTEMNLSKNIPAEAIAMAGNTSITGLTNIDEMGAHRSPANSEVSMLGHGATVLGPGDAVAVEYDTGTSGLCDLEIHFHYEGIDEK